MEPPDFDPTVLEPLGFPREPEVDRIVERFFRGLPARLEGVRASLPAVDDADFGRLTHRVRGGAASLGFPRLEAVLGESAPPAEWKSRAARAAVRARRAYRRARDVGWS